MLEKRNVIIVVDVGFVVSVVSVAIADTVHTNDLVELRFRQSMDELQAEKILDFSHDL